MNLLQKLLSIQKEIIALEKNAKANNYSYVNGDKLLSHIKPKMNELGLLLKSEVLSITNVRQDYNVGKGEFMRQTSEILTTLNLKFTWIDTDTKEREECLFVANGQNGWDKGVGSALTYGERYFLLKFFHLETDKDDIDNPEVRAKIEQEQKRLEELEDKRVEIEKSIKATKSLEDLKSVWESIPSELQSSLKNITNSQKAKLEPNE